MSYFRYFIISTVSFYLSITWLRISYIANFEGLTENRYGELGSLFKYFLIITTMMYTPSIYRR